MGACSSACARISAADAQLAADEARVKAEAKARLPDGSSWVKDGWGNEMGGPELEPLFASTTVIDVAWLVDFADGKVMPERKGVVPAWQELPPEAKVSITQLRKTTYFVGLSVAILSYGWAARHHPDPTGELLRRLLPALRSMVNGKASVLGTSAKRGLVWDFLSLPQRGYTAGYDAERDDRTDYQLKRFAKGLSSINVWYGRARVTALVCNWPMPADAENQHSIQERGWCLFERRLSSIVKVDRCYLRMSLMSRLPSGAENMDWWGSVAQKCKAGREPVIAPDAFEQRMRDGIVTGKLKFTNGKDATKVCIPQYEEAFARLLGATDRLWYASLGWDAEQGKQLAAALAHALRAGIPVAAQELHLFGNKLGGEGARAIGEVIEAGALPLLRTFNILNNGADADAQKWIERVARAAGCKTVRA